jgi:hypothetical protein
MRMSLNYKKPLYDNLSQQNINIQKDSNCDNCLRNERNFCLRPILLKCTHNNSFRNERNVCFRLPRPLECIHENETHFIYCDNYEKSFQPPKKIINKNSFRCYICEKSFTTNWNMEQHCKQHFPKTVMCDRCGKMFFTLHDLKRHIKKKHLQQSTCSHL